MYQTKYYQTQRYRVEDWLPHMPVYRNLTFDKCRHGFYYWLLLKKQVFKCSMYLEKIAYFNPISNFIWSHIRIFGTPWNMGGRWGSSIDFIPQQCDWIVLNVCLLTIKSSVCVRYWITAAVCLIMFQLSLLICGSKLCVKYQSLSKFNNEQSNSILQHCILVYIHGWLDSHFILTKPHHISTLHV